MAVAYIGTGTWIEVLNTAITPGLPTRAADDVLVAVIALRSRTATVSVTSGSGWTERINYPSSWSSGTDRIYVFTRTATNTTADNVTFTPSGGDATVDVVGFIFSARGADLSNPFQTTYSTYSDTATNEDIPTTALTVAKAGSMAVVVGIKANDSGATTEILTPSGWTVIMLDDSTLGSDILLGSYYKITSADNESANPGTLDVQPSSSAASVSSVIFAIQEPASGTSYDNSLTVTAGGAVSGNGIGALKGSSAFGQAAAQAQGSTHGAQVSTPLGASGGVGQASNQSVQVSSEQAVGSGASAQSNADFIGTPFSFGAGSGVRLASAGNYLSPPDTFDYNAPYTVMLWARDLGSSVKPAPAVLLGESSTDYDATYSWDNSGWGVELDSRDDDLYITNEFAPDARDSNWHHWALVRISAGVLRLYKDGALVLSADAYVANRGAMAALCFGGRPGDSDFTLLGDIASARAWANSLSAEEIAAEMGSAVSVRSSNLFGDWPLEGVAEADWLADVSGSDRHLVRYGAAISKTPIGLFAPQGLTAAPDLPNVGSSLAALGTVSSAIPASGVRVQDWDTALSKIDGLFDINAAHTIAGWVRVGTDIDNDVPVYNTNSTDYTRYDGIWFYFSYDVLSLVAEIGESGNSETLSTELTGGLVWRHVAFVRESAAATKVYVDGNLELNFSLEITVLDGAEHITFANWSPDGSSSYPGIDFALWRIWTDALDSTEIASEMASAVPVRTEDLWGAWLGPGNSEAMWLQDSSGNGRNLANGGTELIAAPDGLLGDPGTPGLQGTTSISEASGLSATGNTPLSGTGQVSQASQQNALVSTPLNVSGDVIVNGRLSAAVSLQLVHAAMLARNGGLGLFGTVPLAQVAGVAHAGLVSIPASITLSHLAALQAAAQLSALAGLSLGQVASALQNGSLTVVRTLSVDVAGSIAILSRFDAAGNVVLWAAGNLNSASQLAAIGTHTLAKYAHVAAGSSASFGVSSDLSASVAQVLATQLVASVQAELSGAASAVISGRLNAAGSVSVTSAASVTGNATAQFVNALVLAGIATIYTSYGGAQVLDMTLSLDALTSLVQSGVLLLTATTELPATAEWSAAGKLALPASLTLASAGLVDAHGNLSIEAAAVLAQVALADFAGRMSAQVTVSLPIASVFTAGANAQWAAVLTLNGGSVLEQSSRLDAIGRLTLPAGVVLSRESLQVGNVGLSLSVTASAGESLGAGADSVITLDAVAGLTATGKVDFSLSNHLSAASGLEPGTRLDAGARLDLAHLAGIAAASQLQGVAGLDLSAVAMQVQVAVLEMFGTVAATVQAGAVVHGAVLQFTVQTPDGRLFTVSVDLRTGAVAVETRHFPVSGDLRRLTVD